MVAQAPAKQDTATKPAKGSVSAASGARRRRRAIGVHPAKSIVTASCTSQRAALLARMRKTTAASPTPPSNCIEEEPTPEALRGAKGVTDLNISLESSPLTAPLTEEAMS